MANENYDPYRWPLALFTSNEFDLVWEERPITAQTP